jgi:hypothetical protein
MCAGNRADKIASDAGMQASVIARVFGGPGQAVFPTCIPSPPPKAEGARNAGVHNGPTDLDASRYRGLPKSE